MPTLLTRTASYYEVFDAKPFLESSEEQARELTGPLALTALNCLTSYAGLSVADCTLEDVMLWGRRESGI